MRRWRGVAAATLACACPSLAFAAPTIAGCPQLPADNIWNARVDTLPVHPNSAAYVSTIGAARGFHMDFGSGLFDGAPIGIPFVAVPGTQPKVPVTFDFADESDPGPYPIPPDAPIEGVGSPDAGGDRHVLIVDNANCRLYETFASYPQGGGTSWIAGSGAVYDLRSNALRPSGWTSADAAGLPMLPGLVRYEEVAAGEIRHALRFTAPATRRAFVWPARHFASSSTDPARPPMGLRLRLKAGVNIEGLSPHARVIAQAMKTYGIMLADNGSAWFVSGAPDPRWNNDVLHELDALRGADFEAVDTSLLMAHPDSGRAGNDIFTHAWLFAAQQYRDFLSREGDLPGIAHWSQQLASGAQGRGNMVETFFGSAEFQGAIAPVVRLYFAYFLRIPDYGGLQHWIGQSRAGVPFAQISQAFALSEEFTLRYGALDDAQFVALVYGNVLGRAPDAGGLAHWTQQLAGGMTRGDLMAAFSESPEYRALIGDAVYVTMMYVGMLRRSPEQGGFDFWTGYLRAGNSGLALIDGFLGSQEYRQRFIP